MYSTDVELCRNMKHTFDIVGRIFSDMKLYLMKTGVNELKNSIFLKWNTKKKNNELFTLFELKFTDQNKHMNI